MHREINGRVRPPSAVEHGWRLAGRETRELLADTMNVRFKDRATWLHGYPLTMRRGAPLSIHCDDSSEKFSSSAGIRTVLPLLHCDGPMKQCVAEKGGRNNEDVGRTSGCAGVVILCSAVATIVSGLVCCWASPPLRADSIAPISQSNISPLAQLSYVGLVQLAHFLSRPPSLMMEVLTSKSIDLLIRRIGETVGGTYGRRTCT